MRARREHEGACAPTFEGSSLDLPDIAPEHLGDADQHQNRTVNGPMIVADHEADAKCQVKALEDPDCTHQDHRDADQAADNSHSNIECLPHMSPFC